MASEKSKYKSIRSLRSLDLLNSTNKEGDCFMEIASDAIKELCEPFILTYSDWEDVMNRLNKEVARGLGESDNENGTVSSLKMINTHVTRIPTYKDLGTYLTLDFKGRFYRVLLITFSEGLDKSQLDETLYTIPRKIRTTSGEVLFNYIAETIYDFLSVRELREETFNMGICFAYPVQQESLTQAHLINWTKEFSARGVVGKDVVKLLQTALDRLELKVTIRALINDTVGVLSACAIKDPDCAMGLIIGAGTNCCYIEKRSNINKPVNLPRAVTDVILNTEWGSFGSNGCLKKYLTEYDFAVDEASQNPKHQIFEKMIASIYLGELCRLVIVKAVSKQILFNGYLPEKLNYPNSFESQYVFEIDRDPPQVFFATEVILRERFKISSIRRCDLVAVRYICRVLLTRAANLAGAACACIINRINRRRVTIAVDGSLFRFSPIFPALLVETITQLVPYSCTFKLKLTEEGNGKGAAAVVAAEMNAHEPTPTMGAAEQVNQE